MDHKQLERFVDVVESGSLSRTARRLKTTQPALSKSLRMLEEQLGVRLLDRGPRGVRLTRYGDAFYRRARSITAEMRRAREELEELKGSGMGAVSLGVTPGPGILDRIIPQAIERLVRQRSAMRVRVRSGTLSELLIELHRGDLDLLFTVLDERTSGTDLKILPVFEDHFVLVVGRRHPLLAREMIALPDLVAYRWALLEDALPLWNAIHDLAEHDQIAIAGAPIESNSVVFVRTVVAETDFVGVLPSYAAELGAEAGEIVALPAERMAEHRLLPRLVRPMGLVHSADVELTRATEMLLSSLTASCQEMNRTRRRARAPLQAGGRSAHPNPRCASAPPTL
jgi:DNA-binding transcriptional LysR family regulator